MLVQIELGDFLDAAIAGLNGAASYRDVPVCLKCRDVPTSLFPELSAYEQHEPRIAS